MQAIQGYYDGEYFRPLEKMIAKPNQRVIITITDDFIEPASTARNRSMRGILARYADPDLAKREEGAWERAVVERYGDT